MSEPVQSEEDLLLRKALLTPCETKEDLRDWMRFYLDLDFPDTIVDPESTTSPLGAIWELYDAMRKGNRPDLQRIMWYASRDSYKTLGAAAMEILAMLHLRRDVGHMAAVESQALNSQQYVKAAFMRPYLRDYLVSDNVEKVVVRWYEHRDTGENFTEKEFKGLSENEKNLYTAHEYFIKIVICTVRGANSLHVPFFVVDEVDIAPPVPYEESKFIPTERNGKLPVTLLISTRKSRFGLVQKEIDEASQTDLHIRHWNIFEITKPCLPERHKPELPKIDLWVSDEFLDHKTQAEYELLAPEKRETYEKKEAFAGCAKCPLFGRGCKGNLATRQTSDAGLMKSIEYTIGKFKGVGASPAYAKAQLLCRKPDTAGLIYPHFDRDIHMITAKQMIEIITGEPCPTDVSKPDLINFFKGLEGEFVAGMDHGHTHNFVAASYFKYGTTAFYFDVQSAAQLELEDKIALCDSTLRDWNPEIFPDPEDPGANKTLKRKGFRVKNFDKYKGSVVEGIDIVRARLRPASGKPQMYMLKDDEGCELAAKHLSEYHWKVDSAGRPTNIPDEKNDDEPDAVRYGIMNKFSVRSGRVIAAADNATQNVGKPSMVSTTTQVPTQQNYLNHFIHQHLGIQPDEDPPEANAKIRSGGFFFDM